MRGEGQPSPLFFLLTKKIIINQYVKGYEAVFYRPISHHHLTPLAFI